VNVSFTSPGLAGFQACLRNGRPAVRQVGPDTAARAAGLRAGDWILAVDGRSAAGLAASTLQAMALGPPGAPLDLLVATPGEAPRPVRVVRKGRNRTAVTDR
jgi:C-terminal processing protease CtpA/Prc